MTLPDTARTILITGGASGIGRAAALLFARQQANVVIADQDADRAEAAAREIKEAGAAVATAIGDLSDRAVAEAAVEVAVDTFGGIDVLVNNAGILDKMSAAADTDDHEWLRVLEVNLTAPFLVTRAALPHLLKSASAAIVFTASEASLRGSAAGAAYTASKHGVVGLARSLAVMYRDSGIRTNVVAPGGTLTNLQLVDTDVDPDGHGLAVLQKYQAVAGRIADPSEPAEVIAFLASSAASNVNGAIVPVDNGWSVV